MAVGTDVEGTVFVIVACTRALKVLQFFLFLHCSPLDSLLLLHTVPLECHQPKHSFLSIHCAWFLYPVSTFLLWTSFALHALSQHSLLPSITLPIYSLYIHLGFSTMNTAWSVHRVLTYLNDDISCISLNLNLLDLSLFLGSLRVSTLLLSACSL